MKTWNWKSLINLSFWAVSSAALGFLQSTIALGAESLAAQAKNPSPAATPTAVKVLTWNDVVALATEANAEYQGAKATVKQNEALVQSAWGNFLPTVSLGLESSYSQSDVATTTSSGTVLTSNETTNTAKVSVSQNLFNGFADKARVDQAKQNLQAAQAALDIVRASLSSSLKSAFQSLLVAQRTVELAEDIISRRKRNYELVSLRFDGGRENKGSVLLSKANLDQAEYEKIQALNSVEAARLKLARAIGREDLGQMTIQGSVPVENPPVQVDILSLATDTPELRQAIAQEKSAQSAVRVAKESYFPSLDLSASLGRTGDEWFPQSEQQAITLSLSYPLFNGGKDVAGVKAAAAEATVSSRSRETALRDKVVSLREAFNSYVEAVRKAKVDQTYVEAARVRAEIGRSKYNTGLLSFEEWDTIESDLVTREKNALTSQNNRVSAEATWEQTQGRGVIP